MTLEERVMLEAGLEWEAEQAPESGADDDGGPTRSNTLNLDEMAALGAQVS